MATVKPFRGLHPKKELVAKVACPPYDVLSSQEARGMAQKNPLSFLHIAKSEIDLDPAISIYDERVYAKAEENFTKLISDGILIQDERESFYIYKLVMGKHEQVGLMAGLSVDEYENDIIKKHELTRPDKEEDRTKHIQRLNANTGLVFMFYKADRGIGILINGCAEREPLFDFVRDDGVRHVAWRIDDPATVQKIVDAFAHMKAIYVADGHHRSAAACRVREAKRKKNPGHTGKEEYNYFLGALFPDDQVQILSYNRVVKDLNDSTAEEFLRMIRERNFEVSPSPQAEPYSPESPHTFGMYLSSKWYKLSASEKIIMHQDPVESLDVQILQKNLLGPVLNIDDPRTNRRIDFVGGIRGLGELMKKVDCEGFSVAFSFYPTSIKDLMKIADAGKTMPPKSTWFEPKLLSGLIMHLLE